MAERPDWVTSDFERRDVFTPTWVLWAAFGFLAVALVAMALLVIAMSW